MLWYEHLWRKIVPISKAEWKRIAEVEEQLRPTKSFRIGQIAEVDIPEDGTYKVCASLVVSAAGHEEPVLTCLVDSSGTQLTCHQTLVESDEECVPVALSHMLTTSCCESLRVYLTCEYGKASADSIQLTATRIHHGSDQGPAITQHRGTC